MFLQLFVLLIGHNKVDMLEAIINLYYVNTPLTITCLLSCLMTL